MQIHVARNGQQLGQYSVEEINRKLADGTFFPADLAWHEGAAGWAPLSGVPGVTIPSGPTAPPPTAAMPAPPAATPPAPSPYPPQPAPSVTTVAASPPSYQGMVVTSWALLGVTFVISLIPILGCGSWFLVWPVALATLIMAIVILTRGGKTQGTLLLLASILIVPLALIAPVITTAALGGSVSKAEQKQETEIMENLRAISEAKARWVAQTRVPEGAKTTLAGLSPYLDGKEIKSIVGEVYDPKPVGQDPIATLPATKSLASHAKGAVLTASDSSGATSEETPSPTTTPETL